MTPETEKVSSSWLDALIESVKEAESPIRFFYWAGLVSIAASIKSNVWIQKGNIYELFPNIFVLFVAKSGLRKGFPVNVAQQLVTEVGNTRVIAGRNSIESIIQDFGTAYTKPEGGPPIVDATGLIVSDEFSNVIIRNQDAFTLLTEWYDTHAKKSWKNTLKGSGITHLKNVCVTLLGGLNPTHFADIISYKEVTGGFIGRCVVVLEKKRSKINALIEDSEEPVFSAVQPAKYLKELSLLKGRFKLDRAAKDLYKEWYENNRPEEKEDETGSENRIHDTILKVAMLVALSKKPELVIRRDDMEEAMTNCLNTLVAVNEITMGSKQEDKSDKSKRKALIGFLLNRPGFKCTRRVLLQNNYENFSSFELDKMIDSLSQAGLLVAGVEGSEVVYGLTQILIDRYKKIEKEVGG